MIQTQAGMKVRRLENRHPGAMKPRIKQPELDNYILFSAKLGLFAPLYMMGKDKEAKKAEKKRAFEENLKEVQLPTEGDVVFVLDKKYHPQMPLPRGDNNGFRDEMHIEWVKGPSRTAGDDFEWDVQLSKKGLKCYDSVRKGRNHLNVSPEGRIKH